MKDQNIQRKKMRQCFMSCPKLVCLKNFPIVRSMNSQNLDVYTFMERACIHDFYT